MSRPAYILTPPMRRALRDALDEWRIWLAYRTDEGVVDTVWLPLETIRPPGAPAH